MLRRIRRRPGVLRGDGQGDRRRSEEADRRACTRRRAQLLEPNRDRVEALAKALIKYETLDGDDIDRIMRGDILTKPTVSDLLDQPPHAAARGVVIQPPTGPELPPGGDAGSGLIVEAESTELHEPAAIAG